EHQDAAGIVSRDIVVHVGIEAVLNLDAGHVVFGTAVLDDDILRLSYIDAGVGCAPDRDPIDEHVRRGDGIDTIRAVLRPGSAGPFDDQIDHADAIDTLGLHAVAARVLNREISNSDVVRGDEKPLRFSFLPV